MKKIIQRTCIGCNCKKDKRELIRIILDGNNVVIDKTGKLQGRGTYICGEEKCLNHIIKVKKLEKVLSTKIEDEFYKNIQEVINEKINKNKESEEGDSIGKN